MKTYQQFVVEARRHNPPYGWKSSGGGPDDKPTVKIPLSGVMQGGWLEKEKEEKKKKSVNESGDWWHPDPEQDRKLGGPGPNQRAREDAAERSKPKEDPKKLRSGESYMDYAKRHGYSPSTPKKKPGLLSRILKKEENEN